jgi:ankyrin repeat protein
MSYDTSTGSALFEELLQCARYGDLEDLNEYTSATYIPATALASVLAQKDEHGNTMLHYACANGHISIVQRITQQLSNQDMNIQNDGGNTALHWASLNGHLDCVKHLLDAGSDPKIVNKAKRLPVDEAESQGKESVVLWFLALDMKREKEALDAEGIVAAAGVEEEDGTFKMTAGEVEVVAEEQHKSSLAPETPAASTTDDLDDLD